MTPSRLHSILLITIIFTLISAVFTNGTETDSSRRGGGFYLWKDFPLDELSKTPKFRSFYQFCFAGEDRCPIDDKSLISKYFYLITKYKYKDNVYKILIISFVSLFFFYLNILLQN